jgi:hypothetical protein
MITKSEAKDLRIYHHKVMSLLAVDDFAPDEIGRLGARGKAASPGANAIGRQTRASSKPATQKAAAKKKVARKKTVSKKKIAKSTSGKKTAAKKKVSKKNGVKKENSEKHVRKENCCQKESLQETLVVQQGESAAQHTGAALRAALRSGKTFGPNLTV